MTEVKGRASFIEENVSGRIVKEVELIDYTIARTNGKMIISASGRNGAGVRIELKDGRRLDNIAPASNMQ